jgi:hypothetical protein
MSSESNVWMTAAAQALQALARGAVIGFLSLRGDWVAER